MQQNTFSNVRTHFKDACDQVVNDQDILLVTRRDADNIVMMPQSLFDAWQETVYLLKSPANAAALAKSIAQHRDGQVFERELFDVEED
jgi:antitoxin YefM